MTILAPQPFQGQHLPDHTQLPETDGSIETELPGTSPGDAAEQTRSSRCSTAFTRIDNTRSVRTAGSTGGSPPPAGRLQGARLVLHSRRSAAAERPGASILRHVAGKDLPVLMIEFVSGDGREERDTTPNSGKFWVYERGIRAAYYAIYEFAPGRRRTVSAGQSAVSTSPCQSPQPLSDRSAGGGTGRLAGTLAEPGSTLVALLGRTRLAADQ